MFRIAVVVLGVILGDRPMSGLAGVSACSAPGAIGPWLERSLRANVARVGEPCAWCARNREVVTQAAWLAKAIETPSRLDDKNAMQKHAEICDMMAREVPAHERFGRSECMQCARRHRTLA
jgi:hypothetical protein